MHTGASNDTGIGPQWDTHSNQAEYQFCIMSSLPTELWTLIIDEYVSQPAERLSLALTSRLLHDITLPSLFKCLSFTRFDPREPVAPFTHVTDRIEFLHSRPDVRGYVREVVVYGWFLIPSSPHYRETIGATKRAYGVIESILLMLPRLRKLTIIRSPITLRMRSVLPRMPHLQSLDIRDIYEYNVIEYERGSQTFFSHGFHSLKELTFLCQEPGLGTFYLKQLLINLAPEQLTRLCVHDWCLPHISKARISLRALLQVEIGLEFGSQWTDTNILYHLLSHSQDIREIRVRPTVAPNSHPPPETVLPRLECVSGPIDILVALVPGRPVWRIELFAKKLSTPLGFTPLQKSTVDITSLTLYIGSLSAVDIRHCGQALTKLRHFDIQLKRQPSWQNCIVRLSHQNIFASVS